MRDGRSDQLRVVLVVVVLDAFNADVGVGVEVELRHDRLGGLSRGDERALRGCSRSVRTGPVTCYTAQPGWPGRGVGE